MDARRERDFEILERFGLAFRVQTAEGIEEAVAQAVAEVRAEDRCGVGERVCIRVIQVNSCALVSGRCLEAARWCLMAVADRMEQEPRARRDRDSARPANVDTDMLRLGNCLTGTFRIQQWNAVNHIHIAASQLQFPELSRLISEPTSVGFQAVDSRC